MSDRLNPNQSLPRGGRLTSPNGQYYFTFQTDGNIVLYNRSNHAYWSPLIQGKGGTRATMQSDGNFVVYNSRNQPIWHTHTNGNPGAYLKMQDDGNLVIYQGTKAVWASNTPGGRIHTHTVTHSTIIGTFASTMGKGITGVSQGVIGIGKGVVQFGKGALSVTGRLITSPVKFAEEAVRGRNIFAALGDTVKRDLTTIKDAGPYVMTVISFVPGIGTGVTGAISAGLALANGQNITDALIAGAKGAIPGGPIAQQAFETGIQILKGRNVADAVLEGARNQLPPEAQQAFDIGVAMAKGRNMQDAAMGLLVQNAAKLLPIGAGLAESVGITPLWTAATETIQGLPGKFTKGIASAVVLGKAASLKDTILATAREQLPGGAAAQMGFDVATGLIVQGKRYNPLDLQKIRDQLPAGYARMAFDAAFNLHAGRLNGKPAPAHLAPAGKVAYYTTKGLVKNQAPPIMKQAVAQVTAHTPQGQAGLHAAVSEGSTSSNEQEMSYLMWIWNHLKNLAHPKATITVKGELES